MSGVGLNSALQVTYHVLFSRTLMLANALRTGRMRDTPFAMNRAFERDDAARRPH